MTWTDLQANGTVQVHRTSTQEIDDLRRLIRRDLADAGLDGLSADRKFAIAYNAVLQLSKMMIALEGYRVSTGSGHHQKTFDIISTAYPVPKTDEFSLYFEVCRRKRNRIDYDAADTVSDTEAKEIVAKANDFLLFVEAWIAGSHPNFK